MKMFSGAQFCGCKIFSLASNLQDCSRLSLSDIRVIRALLSTAFLLHDPKSPSPVFVFIVFIKTWIAGKSAVGQRKVSGKYLDNLENRSICVHIIITFLFETTATPKLSSSISKQTIQRKRSDLEAYWPFRSKKNAGADGLVKW